MCTPHYIYIYCLYRNSLFFDKFIRREYWIDFIRFEVILFNWNWVVCALVVGLLVCLLFEMAFIRCSIVLSLWFCHSVNAFGIRNSDSVIQFVLFASLDQSECYHLIRFVFHFNKKPPEKLFRLTRSMHDLCMKMTTVTEGLCVPIYGFPFWNMWNVNDYFVF